MTSCADKTIPVSNFVDVTVSKTSTVSTTDLSVPVFVSSTPPTNSQAVGRIFFYSTLTSLQGDWGTTSEASKAGRDFFSQNPRARTMAVAVAYSTPQPAYLFCATAGDLSNFQAINDATFQISINGVEAPFINNINLQSTTSMDDVATAIQAELVARGFIGAKCEAIKVSDEYYFKITSGETGDGVTISYLSDVNTGTDISGTDYMNGQDNTEGVTIIDGYTPTTFTNELNLIVEAAGCSGKFVYGFSLDVAYREQDETLDMAAYTEAQDYECFMAISNNVECLNSESTTDQMALLSPFGYIKTIQAYHQNANYYPCIASLGYMLSVDYNGKRTVTQLAFKSLAGIPATSLSETQLSTIYAKNGNAFIKVDNGTVGVQEGRMINKDWFLDDRINTDNFVNDLVTAIYNVFLTNKIVPYSSVGIDLIRHAEQKVCEQYVTNGTFSERTEDDLTSPTGEKKIPAYSITFPALQDISLSNRANRILPGNSIVLQLTGGINKVIVSITLNT